MMDLDTFIDIWMKFLSQFHKDCIYANSTNPLDFMVVRIQLVFSQQLITTNTSCPTSNKHRKMTPNSLGADSGSWKYQETQMKKASFLKWRQMNQYIIAKMSQLWISTVRLLWSDKLVMVLHDKTLIYFLIFLKPGALETKVWLRFYISGWMVGRVECAVKRALTYFLGGALYHINTN